MNDELEIGGKGFAVLCSSPSPISFDSQQRRPKFFRFSLQNHQNYCCVVRLQKMEAGDDGIERLVDSKDMQQQSKAFDKLTDRVEDRQLDSTRVQEVFTSATTSFCFSVLV